MQGLVTELQLLVIGPFLGVAERILGLAPVFAWAIQLCPLLFPLAPRCPRY